MEPFQVLDNNVEGSGEFNSCTQTSSISRRAKPRNGGLLQKLFSRRPSNDNELDIAENEQDSRNFDILSSLSIGPNPSIRPLGHKLVAREETCKPSSPRAVSRPETSWSRTRQFGEKPVGEAESLATLLETSGPQIHEIVDSDLPQTDDAIDTADTASIHSPTELCLDRISIVCETVAGDAALNRYFVSDWISYLRSYVEGHYNIMNPPPPPPRDAGFRFLPAIYPSNEKARLAAIDKWNVNWSDCLSSRARDICNEAMAKFGVANVAISVFDRDHEILMAEKGWSRKKIKRWESIAGHVLLSCDVMVVLDTHKDWRFRRNPFVTGAPHVRFFAGAPMMAPDGEVVGVFSIFSTEARTEYTPFQRRDLCDFALTAMSDLTTSKEYIPDSERETPILQREDLIDGTATYGNGYPTAVRRTRITPSVFDLNLIPHALQYQKTPPSPKLSPLKTAFEMSGDEWTMLHAESTKDNTSPFRDFDGSVFIDEERSKTLKQLTVKEAIQCVAAGGEFTSEAQDYDAFSFDDGINDENMFNRPGTLTPAPRGSKILTSALHDSTATTIVCSPQAMSDDGEVVDPPRPESPVLPASDSDYDEPSLSFDSATGIFTDGTFSDIENALAIAQNNINEAQETNAHAIEASRASVATLSTLSTDVSERDLINTDPRTEAKFAAEFWAQNLGYEVIYAIQMDPIRDFMTEAQLREPGAFRVRTLVSVGLEGDIDFDAGIHLRTLRSSGAIVWGCNEDDPGEFSRGVLMSLAHDRADLKDRTHGIIFGAFKRIPDNGEMPEDFTTVEFAKLQDAALVLRNILLKPVSRPRRANTEPCTPSQFLADEATPIKYSLDAGTRRLEDQTNLHLVRGSDRSI